MCYGGSDLFCAWSLGHTGEWIEFAEDIACLEFKLIILN